MQWKDTDILHRMSQQPFTCSLLALDRSSLFKRKQEDREIWFTFSPLQPTPFQCTDVDQDYQEQNRTYAAKRRQTLGENTHR